MHADELTAHARKLPPAERAKLVEQLLATFDAPDPRIDALWAEEAERRLKDIDEGKSTTRDAREVIANLRSGNRP